jgi:hypothetical protein
MDPVNFLSWRKIDGPYRGPYFDVSSITEGTFEEVTLQRANQDTTTHDPPLTSCGLS